MNFLEKMAPLYEDHDPLVMGWADEQLILIRQVLDPLLPAPMTDDMMRVVASVSRSLMVAKKRNGLGVHYYRGNDYYSVAVRYRYGDRFYTRHYVLGAVAALTALGLVEGCIGDRFCGKRSVLTATDSMTALIGPLVEAGERRGSTSECQVEYIELRDAKDASDRSPKGILLDYEDTEETEWMRERAAMVNDGLQRLQLELSGQRCPIPPVCRIFNRSFYRGGRHYFKGSSFQNLPGDERRRLHLVHDGSPRPMIELDYSALHITMAYAEAGLPLSAEDPYIIPGFPRELVKRTANILFNAATKRSANLALRQEFREDAELRMLAGIPSPAFVAKMGHSVAQGAIEAVCGHHQAIAGHFGSDCGARFQRVDSDMAAAVMATMMEKTGRCPLPVHDSFVVVQDDVDLLRDTMVTVAREYGYELRVEQK